MTIWQEVPETSKQGIVIYNFNHDEPHTLQLNVGENVYILRQSDDWFYGSSANNRRQKGVFPKSYVRLKCNTWQNRQTGSHHKAALQEAQLVEEITSVLNEWNDLWKRLYIMNRSCASDFEDMRIKMTSLIDSRKLIMSSKHTVDEMKELKQRVTTQIDLGNARLGLDLVVRDEEGNILDPVMTSSVSLFRRHQVAAKKKVNRTSDTSDHKKSTSFNLFVNVKNFVCRIGDDADILMMLYDAKKGQPISENYVMKWGNQGMPRNLELLNYLSVLFTDLGLQDSNRERVFLVCLIIRLGRMDLRLPDTKKQSHGLRRPFGVAATEVTEILNGNVQADEEKQYFVPFQLCSERDFLDNVIKKVVTAKEINHKGQGVWVTMKKLQGDLKQVQKEFPHLMTNTTAIARKMGFPDVIMPDDVRYDLYVTILQAELKRTGRSTDRNIEVTLCVCNQNGDVLQNVISEGAGGNMVSEYKTVVYYHDDKPKWCETVKVAIPIDDFYGSHLKLMFKHRASAEAKDRCERPFAMSYIKLMQDNGTTLRDTTHDLLVYKIDSKKMDQSSTYLKLPATERDLESQGQPGQSPSKCQIHAGGLTLNINDSFQISTLVCSTKLTHNVDLMGLLKWRDNLDGLKAHLCAFMQVDGEEIVKFLQDTLDALFNILMQNSDSDLYDNLVFDALIFLVSLISDRKYSQFRPVLDLYIKENFSATLAYNKLMVVLKYYIANVLDQNEHKEKLLKAMKSLEYLFKFIIRSRILFAAMNEGRGKQQFEISLKQVFQSINNLMHDTTPKTLLIQAATLKFLPTTISDVITVYNPHEFSRQLVEFLSSVPPERLTQQKMTCVNDIIHSTLFHIPDCRKVLMPFIVDTTHQLLERKQELEICVKLLCDLMDLLFRNDIGSTRSDLSVITLSGLRTVIQTVITMDRTGPLVGSCVAVMLSVLRQMTEFHYTQYIKNFETPFDLMDFLMEILMVFRDLIGKNVYPPDWVQMIMLQNSIFLKALRYFSHTIRDSFSNPFEYQVWNNFFHCAIAFLTQQSLQLEMFSPTKRDKIISKYKDMRRETAFEIRSMWFNLGQQKLEFIPEIVGPFLEMTLLPEIELRKATIPIFFDMMQYEFMSKPIAGRPKHIRGNFHTFEDEIITKLDVLVEGGRGDEQYRELFYNTIRSQCESHSTIREQGLLFVEVIKELLQRLLEYRAILNDENKENRMSCTVNLLNFYESIQRQEMYIRYLHKLCDLHLECDNYTEAAYTLLLYAKLLHWSDETLPHMLHSDKYADMETHRELKERLYYDIIDFFDKGKMWEKGIELCKELAHQGECETFDYIQLGEILQRQARFYDCIMKQMRPEPEYFRVGFYGLGFPSFLQNKVFVYRGKEYERLSDFAAGLQNQFPNAQLMRTLSEPGDDLKLSSSQYLQINSVRPIMELKPHLQNKRVHEQILKYYKVNEVQEFTFKRKKDELKNDVTHRQLVDERQTVQGCMRRQRETLWLDRTYLDTSYPLPGILRWFNVVSTRVEEVSPLECAIETLTTTNQKLKSLISQHQLDAGLRVDPLGMVLNGVVDAAVNGGIANYKLFYSDAYLEDHPMRDNHLLVKKLRHATTLQLVLLQTALDIHKKKAHVSLQPFQAHMEQRFEQMKEFVEKEYSIKFTEEMKLSLEVRGQTRRVKTMPPQRQSEIHFGSHTVPRPANQAATRVQSTAVTRSVSTFVSAPESPTKLAKRPNFGFSGADGLAEGAETASISSSENSSSRRNSRASKGDRDSVIIELSEQLTPQRPPRPETDRRSRPMSGHFKASPLRTVAVPLTTTPQPVTKSDSHDYDEPPPLPLKHISLEVGGFDPETRNSTAGHKSGYFKERSSLGGSTNHSLVRAEPKKPPPVGESEV